MTTLQYITSKETGCCTTTELMQLSREDKAQVAKLKEWAKEEMTVKGIPITDVSTSTEK